MPDQPALTPFRQFLDSVRAAKHAELTARVTGLAAHADAFEAMRGHILKLYEGTDVAHSFVDENGSVFDCVPIEQQPALKGSHEPIAKAPDLPHIDAPASMDADGRTTSHIEPLGANRKDRFGNVMQCPAGTIPIRRVTLEDMTRYPDLRSFFRKTPGGGAIPPKAPGEPHPAGAAGPQAGVAATHRWAHAFENASNVGGHSYLNVWDPAIGANQIFSLSQHWYVGGSGVGLQTAEVGWQVYPQFYGNSKPVFFIYWTADGYNSTGCYNLTCPAFVQTNPSWTIGGTLSPWSTAGQSQWEIEVAFYLYQGRWWLYVRGTTSSDAIGYYPVSLYKGGAMSKHASEIDYGGETVGTTSFPPMGGGAFASKGWQHAAYHRRIYYFPTAGGSAWASLTPSQAWPKCYTAQLNNYASPWNTTLWFGGPGGSC